MLIEFVTLHKATFIRKYVDWFWVSCRGSFVNNWKFNLPVLAGEKLEKRICILEENGRKQYENVTCIIFS